MKQSKIIILILIVLGIPNIIFAQKPKQPKIVKNGVLEEKLFEALHNDEFEEVKKLIAGGANVNAFDEGSSWRPLHFAVYGHKLELVKILLQKKTQINVRETDGSTPLNLVFTNSGKVTLDTVEIIKALIAAGANVNLATKHNVTPLINAVSEFKVEIEAVKLLLLNKANVDVVDADGNFALQLAVTAGRDDLAELLRPLSKNKIVKNIEKPDDAAFVAECGKGNWLRIKKMIELGANVNAVDSEGQTALHRAAKNSDLMTVELLIKNKAKLNIKDSEGYTALLRAADSSDYSGKSAEVIEALLDAGENAAAKTSSDETSVLLLLNTNPDHINSLKKLLEHDVDLKQKNYAGQTALMLAVAHELELPVIKLMLEKGSDPNQINDFGENALQIAIFTERKDTVELLKPLTETTENRSQFPGKFFDTGAGEMYYEVHGTNKTGTPLFVLHGGPGFDHKYLLSSDAFEKLAENRPVIFYDQRGSGNSTHLTKSGTATIFELVEDLDKLRKHLGYEKIDVLGHSWGGYLAMAYGVQYPQNVEKLVLCDSVSAEYDEKTDDFETAYPVESAEMSKALDGSREYILAYMKMLFYSKEKRDSFIKGSSDYTYSRFANSTIGESASETHIFSKLSYLNFPVLVINGRHDSNILPEIADGISKEIPNSQLVIFENSGHLPFYEEPQKFVEIVGGFLNGKKVSYK